MLPPDGSRRELEEAEAKPAALPYGKRAPEQARRSLKRGKQGCALLFLPSGKPSDAQALRSLRDEGLANSGRGKAGRSGLNGRLTAGFLSATTCTVPGVGGKGEVIKAVTALQPAALFPMRGGRNGRRSGNRDDQAERAGLRAGIVRRDARPARRGRRRQPA